MSDAKPFDMPPASASFEARGGWLINRLAAEFGLTPEQAAGIVGNLGFESMGFRVLQEMVPAVSGSRGGYGWAQWTGPRRRAFEAWCVTNSLKPSSDKANCGYLVAELGGPYRATIREVLKTATLDDAVFSVGQTYERPGGTTETHLPGFDGRLKYAQRALAGASGPVATQGPADIKTRRTLRLTDPQMTGEDVRKLQRLLGPIVGVADGRFGKVTAAAVESFQQARGLKQDGVVGDRTWAALATR